MWALYSALCESAFFVCEQGHLGLVDGAVAQTGDVIGLFLGAQVPFALHEKAVVSGEQRYEFAGEW